MESMLAGFVAACILIELQSMRSEVCGMVPGRWEEGGGGSVNNGNGGEMKDERRGRQER